MAGNSGADYVLKQGDTANTMSVSLTYNDGTAVNLTGATVNFIMRSLANGGVTTNAAATIVTPSSGAVSYSFTATDTASAGVFDAGFQVTFSGGTIQTFPTDGYLSIWIEPSLTTTGVQQLVSLGEVKAHCRVQATDHTHDYRLLQMIYAAQPVIEGITGPIVQRKIQNETYDGGSWFIQLRNKPVLEVEQVVEYRGPIPYNLTQVPTPDLGQIYSYMFEPPGRIVRRTVGGGITPFPPGADQVFVTYIAGYQTTPANVRDVTLELIRENFEQTEMGGRPSFDGGGGGGRDDSEPMGPATEFYLTPRMREQLAPSKRPPSVA